MKIQVIAVAVTVALLGCVSTTGEQSAESILNDDSASATLPTKANDNPATHARFAHEETRQTVAQVVNTPPTLTNGDIKITLEQIMADPDWMGRSPENWYWGDDSQTIFYQQKRVGNSLRDLYSQSLIGDNTKDSVVTKVDLKDLHQVSDRNAQVNSAHTQEVYVFEGNVFVKNLTNKQVTQLTYTSAIERAPMFLSSGNVAYRVNNKFFEHDLTNNRIIELASLKMQPEPTTDSDDTSYIASEQSKLINYVALQKRNKALKAAKTDKLKANNHTVTTTEFYFGKGKRVVHASLSPNANKMIVSVTDSKSTRADSDIMPKYITETAHVETQNVRQRVADNRQYSEQLYLIDLSSGQKFSLDYDTLPGFNDDVLASVKKENYAREGKTYQSKKSPRNIHVMQASQPIKWRDDGEQVAVLLEAWDNKDRWLASVNLLENKLVTQHQLHDDAWINWSFNQFGWLNDKLYYLSEESGYSHLYTKSLKGKAQKLTGGAFEVSNVTLTKDKSHFIFKANKKHPGIYEIYQVAANGGKVEALTDLGGMNDYRLSPDNRKLLIKHSTVTMPPELYVKTIVSDNNKQQLATRITHTVSKKFEQMPWTAPNVVAIKSSHQDSPIYSRVYLPKNYNASEHKNRAVMFTHGAGYLQNSHLGWSGYFREFMFHSMLVQHGYVVIDMDYRASKGYGRDWRTAIYRHMGKPEVEDMRDGVEWLIENANVDRRRIGTYGGSYGGFLTVMSMFTEPDLFESGSAIRLVADWAYYNHGYTSNILNTPGDDPIAYERSSPIYFAQGLEKPLLINAPMVDDNVFFQDSVRLVQRLIELEKQDFETAIYPVEPHGFVQPSSWLNEYRRIFKLFENTL